MKNNQIQLSTYISLVASVRNMNNHYICVTVHYVLTGYNMCFVISRLSNNFGCILEYMYIVFG